MMDMPMEGHYSDAYPLTQDEVRQILDINRKHRA